ncbi:MULTISPECIES: hypothetical protein [unclassified Rathayibacter]|uniref:hypothetical protein n=1 Tax=unclassified Rathayibacter TaxID=2609250 RepID=UPI000F4B63E9|nr:MULTISPECIES: hypothetical protein [unclassified Rathayibacter]ROP56641.1 hypothetical protein EDF45_0161 [Rathayibacter sp. PhB186]ROS55026.1 hypothetical protein EDF44_0161 [Rathayibacter sp. PhB185]
MSSSRSLRTLRGVVAATVATLTALFLHVAGGGEVPGLLGLAVPLVLSVPVCVALAGRGLSLARLAASVGVSQLLFHALFEIGAAAGPAGAAHAHGGPIDVSAATAHAGGHDSSMGIAHLLAAVVTIAVLHRGEALLIAVAATTVHAAARLVRVPAVPVLAAATGRRWSSAPRAILPVVADVLADAVPRRGPPAAPAS